MALILAGCSFNHGSLSSGDGSTTGDSQRPGDGAVDALALTDEGLLVRYFIDEAASGQGPTELADSAPTPLPLALQYTPAMSFSNGRGLHWTTADDAGRASTPIDTTKIETLLDPSKTFTLEVVAAIAANGAGENRFMSVAQGTATYGSIALITSDLVSLRLHLGTAAVYWSVPWAQGRLVIHCVVDTTQVDATDRALLYVNGALATRTGGTSPGLNYDPPILSTDYLTIGNVEGAGRSPAGDVSYVAIYTKALTPAQVAANAQRLAANDDR
jgi:hypothetical protein